MNLRSLRKKRDRGGCDQCGSCSKCTECKNAWDRYKLERNNRTKLARECKRNNVLNDLKAKSVKNDLKGIWKTIKLASNINPSISCDNVGNEFKNPESFNKHFATVASSIQAQVPKFENISFSDFLPARNSDLSFCDFEEVTSDAILSYVKSLARDRLYLMTYLFRFSKKQHLA